MAWGKNGTPHTLDSSADTLTISDLTPNTFNVILTHTLDTGGAIKQEAQYNNDTSSNYAGRVSEQGGADFTQVSQTKALMSGTPISDIFTIMYVLNIAGEEKLVMGWEVAEKTAGAGTAPQRTEQVHKWINTSVQISEIDVINVGAGSYDTNSNLSVLGSDLTPTVATPSTVQDGAVFEETDTNKHYLLDDGTWTEL